MVSTSNHTECMLLSNLKCMTQPTLINLHPNEYTHLRVGSCNTLNDLSNELCVPNKLKDLNLIMFNMIKGINESKILIKHISCEWKRKFDGRKYNSNQKWNNDKCRCDRKKHHICQKDYIWNPATCSCENGKYLASIIDNSVITCDEIIDAKTKTVTTNFNEKNAICKTTSFYILLDFVLITIALLIAVSI